LIVGQFTAEGTPTNMQAAIMSMWNEVGVQTEYTPLDPATQADSTASDNHPYDVTITSFAWLAYDPSTAYASFATERRPDWSNYSTPEFDEVMSEAIRVPVLTDAVPLYQQAALILQNDLPYAPMWLDPEIWEINKKMHGGSLGRGPLNDIQSERWWKES
jgi:ABC-type transport system substrate-binding protein